MFESLSRDYIYISQQGDVGENLFPCITLAEWSNAPDLRSGSFGSVGSNPTRDNLYIALLAQSGERATVNRKVRYREAAGSKPARSGIKNIIAMWRNGSAPGS